MPIIYVETAYSTYIILFFSHVYFPFFLLFLTSGKFYHCYKNMSIIFHNKYKKLFDIWIFIFYYMYIFFILVNTFFKEIFLQFKYFFKIFKIIVILFNNFLFLNFLGFTINNYYFFNILKYNCNKNYNKTITCNKN